MMVDYLIVGSGLTGATIARLLADAGREVMILERRSHVGGNVHDFTHPSGIPIHTYGPHYFRTNDQGIWEFVNRFGRFYPYEASIKSLVDGAFENWPVAASYIKRFVGDNWAPEFHGTPSNFEDASLAMMPRFIYEKFVSGYTEKQWGTPAKDLSPSLARRFDVRLDDEPRLMRHKYQGIPVKGYAALMTDMLAGIPVVLNFDYNRNRAAFGARKVLVFSGPVDEFFDHSLGRLKYRGQQRIHEYFPGLTLAQPCGQVNNPSSKCGPHIRSIEWKHMMAPEYASRITGTVLTKEITITPNDPNAFEYPFPDEPNTSLYKQYARLAASLSSVLICGRLGHYKYLDMDQAIERAFQLADGLLANETV